MSQKQFSILICALDERKHLLDLLLNHLEIQTTKDVEILVKSDNRKMKIGEKRNWLLNKAKGDYVAFIDDDDWVDVRYIPLVLKAIKTNPDCVGMIGIMSTNGKSERRFEHFVQYGNYFELNKIYCRPPNHLNPIRRSIAKQFKFQEINMGEDTDWAMRICKSMKLQTEVRIEIPIYHYRYSSRK